MRTDSPYFPILLLSFLFLIAYAIMSAPIDHTTAILQMDGRGWYRVSDYRLDGNCVHYINGFEEKEVFCGAFSVTEQRNFHTLPSKP